MELKPCPFCGGEARIMKITDSGGKTGYAVGCGRPFCPTDGAVTRWFVDDGLAVEAWNTRHVETCTIERNESGCNFAYRLYTLSCGHTVWTMGDAPNYCPTCGRKVEL